MVSYVSSHTLHTSVAGVCTLYEFSRTLQTLYVFPHPTNNVCIFAHPTHLSGQCYTASQQIAGAPEPFRVREGGVGGYHIRVRGQQRRWLGVGGVASTRTIVGAAQAEV